MKIKYLGLLSCLLICSCDLLRDENYYNVNKDDIREYCNKEFAINLGCVCIFKKYESFEIPPKSFNSLYDEGDMYLTLETGNIKSKENMYIKAISKISIFDGLNNIIFEKINTIDNFFDRKYTLTKSYGVQSDTCNGPACFQYNYHLVPNGQLKIDKPFSFFNQSMKIEITFSLLKEDGSYYHPPLRADTDITYIDGITYVEDFSPWYEVEVYKK